MTDVLLTHSYHLFYDRKQARKMQPYPPLGTLYAAALLREHGFSVALFDSMLEDPEEGFPVALRRYRPRIVAVYEDNFNFLSKMCLTRMREVAFGIAEAAKAAGATVLVNGSDGTDHVDDYLRHGFDYALNGEAEWTLLELVQSLLGKTCTDPADIRGLTFLHRSAERLVRTPPRPLMRDLDALPLPARDLVDMDRYRHAWKAAHGRFSLNIVSSRGCPYQCNWCAKPIYGSKFHVRAPEHVAEEIRLLKDTYGAEHLWFADDIVGLTHHWTEEFAEAVENCQAAIPFKIQSRVDLMTPTTARALARAGCEEVWMGVESGSQKILDAMDKGTRVEQIESARDILRACGIRAGYFLQFGYPGETWEEIRETIELVRRTKPDDIGVSVAYPLPGTVFYDRVRRQLGVKTNWIDSDDLSIMFKGSYTDEFYRALREALHAEVASWNPVYGAETVPGNPTVLTSRTTLVRDLWEKVVLLEKSCRNPEPTLLPLMALASSPA